MDVLVIAAHPDDETLGCGGALLRRRAEGARIHWCVVTSMQNPALFPPERVARREQELRAVTDAFGFTTTHRLERPCASLDEICRGALIADLARVVAETRAAEVYVPHRADVHSDHRVVFEAAFSAVKSFRNPTVRRVLMMETPSETEFAPALPDCAFVPNVFMDVTPYMERKLEIMRLYEGEMAPPPFPRSDAKIRALSAHRGAAAGCEYAEAFMLLKEIL